MLRMDEYLQRHEGVELMQTVGGRAYEQSENSLWNWLYLLAHTIKVLL